jgi:hypothetical protein
VLSEVDRLVLLGDVIELRHGPMREALDRARPVLRALAAALPGGAEVVLVPGNHDHELLAPWLARRSLLDGACRSLGLEAEVDFGDGEALGELAAALSPARVRVAYPGVWLRSDVYALHGHYLDLHTTVPMFERLGAGLTARMVGGRGRDPGSSEDYEAVLAPMYAWIHGLAQGRAGGAGVGRSSHGPSSRAWRTLNRTGRRGRAQRVVLRAAIPLAVRALERAGLGPLHADLSGAELRRAGLRSMGEVLERLEVRASHVIFGHSHRAGPLPGDMAAEWLLRGSTRLINAGCWVHEPAYLGSSPSTSPYRAGFAVRLSDDASEPELVNLLD